MPNRDAGPPPEEGPPVEEPQRPPVDAKPPVRASGAKGAAKGYPDPADEEADVPPSDLLAERCVIGCAVLDGDACAEARRLLEPGDFYPQAHQHIAQAIWAVADAGHPVDVVSVAAELRHRKRLEKVGGVPYLALCGDAVPTTAHAARYAEIVKGKAIQRQVIEVAAEIGRLARDNGKAPAEMVAEALAAVTGISVPNRRAPVVSGDDLAAMIGEPEWLWQDWLLKGYLTFLGAEPGMGKSAVALWIAANLASGGKWPDGSQMRVQTRTLWLDAEGMQSENLKRMRLWGFDRSGICWLGEDGMAPVELHRLGAFRSYVEAGIAAGCSLVVVDSLRFAFAGDEDSSTMVGVLQQVKEVVQEFGIACIIIHHLRKQRETETTAVTLERFRGSSVIGAVARSMWGMWRPDRQNPVARLEVIKANLGPTGQAVGVEWSEKALKFGEAPEGPEKGETRTDRAADFLRAFLERGPRTWREVMDASEAEGITKNAVYDGRDRLGIVSVKQRGESEKKWALPAPRE